MSQMLGLRRPLRGQHAAAAYKEPCLEHLFAAVFGKNANGDYMDICVYV